VEWTRLWRPIRRELRLWGQAAWRALIGLVSRNDLTHAASIAYYSLLSLFPFLLLIISILGVVTADETDRARVLGFVFRYFPTRLDFMADQLDAFRADSVRIGVVGGLGLVWASLGFFGAVTSAVNEAWGVEKQRSFWKHRLVSFLLLVAATLAMAVALIFVSFIQVAETSRFGQFVATAPWFLWLQTFVFRYLALVLLMFGTGLVFYFIPNARTRFRDVWVGAILTGLLWRAALSGFSWYVRQNQRLAIIHGSITTVVVFLLWIYISSVILMYGVEFTAAYARLRRHRTETMPAAASPRE
jgi:membrane protein